MSWFFDPALPNAASSLLAISGSAEFAVVPIAETATGLIPFEGPADFAIAPVAIAAEGTYTPIAVSGSVALAVAPIAQTVSGELVFTGMGAHTAGLSAANILNNSAELDNNWVVGSVIAAAPTDLGLSGIGPDGVLQGHKYSIPAISTAGHISVVYQGAGVSAQSYTCQVWLKGDVGGEETNIMFVREDNTGYASLRCVLTTEWKRFTVTGTGDAVSNWYFEIGTDLTAGSGQFPTSAVTIYVAYAQMEPGTSATGGIGGYKFSPVAVTAVGMVGEYGPAALAIAPIAIDSSGEQVFTGTATVATAPLSEDSSGEQVFTGTVAETVEPIAIIVEGTVDNGIFEGSATAAVAPVAVTSEGTYTPQAITGTTEVAIAPSATSASGEQVFTGSSSVAIAPLATSAEGSLSEEFTGSATVAVAPVAQSSAGEEIFTGGVYTPGLSPGNLLTNSITLEGNWSYGNISTSDPTDHGAVLTGPDGTNSSRKISFPAVSAAGAASVVYQGVGAATVASYTVSMWLRGDSGGEEIYLMMVKSGGSSFTRTRAVLTTEWKRFTATITADTSAWFLQIGTDLRDTSQHATDACTIHAAYGQMEQASAAYGGDGFEFAPLATSVVGYVAHNLGPTDVALAPVAQSAEGTLAFEGTSTFAVAPLASAAEGVGAVSGDATVAVAPLAHSSSGELIFTGTETTALAPIAFTSAGEETFTGTLGVAVAPLAEDSSGTVANPVTGTTEVAVAPIAITSSGEEIFSGATTESLAPLATAAEGTEEFAGSVSIALAPLVEDASGTVANPVTGTTDVAIAPVAITSTGEEVFSGEATEAVAPISASAEGTLRFEGNSALALAPPTLASTGEQTFEATVVVDTAPVAHAASGEEIFSGAASVQVPFDSTAVGSALSGVGDVALATITQAGTGEEVFAGSASLDPAAIAVESAGVVVSNIGQASVSLSALALEVLASLTFEGTATESIEPLAHSGSGDNGAQSITGTVDIAIAPPAPAAEAVQEFSGAVTESLAPVASSAVSTLTFTATGTSEVQFAIDVAALEIFSGASDIAIASLALAGSNLLVHEGEVTLDVAIVTSDVVGENTPPEPVTITALSRQGGINGSGFGGIPLAFNRTKAKLRAKLKSFRVVTRRSKDDDDEDGEYLQEISVNVDGFAVNGRTEASERPKEITASVDRVSVSRPLRSPSR